MHEYEISVLNFLKRQRSVGFDQMASELHMSRDTVLWAIENLSGKGAVRVVREQEAVPKLTTEGRGYERQFPEERLLEQLSKSAGKASLSGIKDQIGLVWAKKNGWVELDKGQIKLTEAGKEIVTGKRPYHYREVLNELGKLQVIPAAMLQKEKDYIDSLKKRNLLEISERGAIKSIEITEHGKGMKEDSLDEGVGTLTRELITTGKWEREKFRKYDINAPVEELYPARQHPMHEFIDIIRRTWFNMGFTEVSGPIVEPAFWVFDALFSPQDHPTRDMQDTFFLKNPPTISIDDLALIKKVKKMHVTSWKDKWREDIAKQAVLRTHVTSVSAHSIKDFSNDKPSSYPLKLFSVGKTFRNEAIDYKHLAEFYQIDGIVIGNSLTFSNLIYTLRQFYGHLGMADNIVIRPAYFPFVEPGLEVYYYDKQRDTSIELCGAGIIRKEITKAMGTNKTVLAWGGGLDRLMLRALGIEMIGELYRNEIGWLRRRRELKI